MTTATWHIPYTAAKIAPPGTFVSCALGDETVRRTRCAVLLETAGVDVREISVADNDLHKRVEVTAVFATDDWRPVYPQYLVSSGKAVDA